MNILINIALIILVIATLIYGFYCLNKADKMNKKDEADFDKIHRIKKDDWKH